MSSILDKIILGAVALGLAFVIISSLILPYFSSAYRYCQALQWEGAEGSVYTNCSNRYQDAFNTSFVDTVTRSHTEGGITSPVEADTGNATDPFCLNCETLGGYRVPMQGMVLLVLVLAIVGFGVYFMPKVRA